MRRLSISLALLLAACGGSSSPWGGAPDMPALTSPLDVWAFSDTDVWVVDGSPMVHRFDGTTWTALPTPAAGLTCIFAISASDVRLCAGTQLVTYDGATFTAEDLPGAVGPSSVTDLWASSPDDLYVVGELDGLIGHWDGASWTGIPVGSGMSSIWGSGPGDVYAMGTFDLVHGSGEAWEAIELEAGGAGDGQVWGTSATDVWAMTGDDRVNHFDGSTWTSIELEGFVGDVAAVWGPSADDLWAVGSPGSIAHYDGDSWSEVTHQKIGAPYLRQFTAVHGSSSTNVWTVGHQLGEGGSTGLIWKYAP